MGASAPSMNASSQRKERIRLPLSIPIRPYFKDHHFEGKIILPAVEILQLLAGSVRSYLPDGRINCMRSASLDRFLLLEGDVQAIEAVHELEIHENGRLSSTLLTEGPIKGAGMTRTKVHATVDFIAEGERIDQAPLDALSALEGVCYRLPSQKLYTDMVPFGSSYQNVRGDIFLSESGGVAEVYGADHPAPSYPLGSTFPLDGAFHVACAWGQRFHHIVAFPVGFQERHVVHPTAPGGTYICRIFPVSVTGKSLTFDISIHDPAGELREYVRGLVMRDISGGRVKPPNWIRSEGGDDPLASIRRHCTAVSVIENHTIADFAVKSLSKGELERFEQLGARRQRSYLAARLALKNLSRKLAGGDRVTPASDIHTMMTDGIRPCCPVSKNRGTIFCSVSHDRRFAIAVAGAAEVGVDVETASDRVLKIRRFYMGKEEMTLTEESPLGVMQASIRIWSIKEGISKATDMPLEESWRRAVVDEVGRNESRLSIEGTRYVAIHDTVDDHIFTLVKKES